MTVIRSYTCPGNGVLGPHAFDYLHHPSMEEDPLPGACPVCGFDKGVARALAAPHLGRPVKDVVDGMYRQMEAGAQHRADVAREIHGFTAEEAANMKMTDMRDHLHEGDTSDIPVVNEVSRSIETIQAAAPNTVGFVGGGGAQYAGPVNQGAYPRAGNRAREQLRAAHASNMRNAGHAGVTVSTVPHL